MAGGMIFAIIISNIGNFINDGEKLDELRESVLRLHILANSDSETDQDLKLSVRDALLENNSEIFEGADSREEAEWLAEKKLGRIEQIAEETLAKQGCYDEVSAKIVTMYFDERTYGDIVMPAGNYSALRVEIGEAKGHNWWCVMYPPLCISAACEEDEIKDDKKVEEEYFDEDQQDIIYNPGKYRVRFAIWDKIKSWIN